MYTIMPMQEKHYGIMEIERHLKELYHVSMDMLFWLRVRGSSWMILRIRLIERASLLTMGRPICMLRISIRRI